MNLTVGKHTPGYFGKKKSSFPQHRVTQKVRSFSALLIYRHALRHLILYRHITSDILNVYIIHMFVLCFYISHLSVV